MPALPSEPRVLQHSLHVLVAGGATALAAFALAYWLEGGSDFGPRFNVGLKAATAVAAGTAGLLTWARLELARHEHHLAADAELTDRFGRSVALLESTDPVIRVGGVFAIERFALDAAARAGARRDVDWLMALNLLAAFAKEHSQATNDGTEGGGQQPPIAVVEAVRVLGRFPQRCGLDLPRGHDLAQINLSGANLAGVNLAGSDLSNSNLNGTNLERAVLAESNLLGASLSMANLSNAHLKGADLGMASLDGATLFKADLSFANLVGADLTRAGLSGANLRNAYVDDPDFSLASYDESTVWPEGFQPSETGAEENPGTEQATQAANDANLDDD